MLSSLLGDFVPYIVGAVALIAAFFGYTHKTKRDTEKRVEAENENAALKDYAKRRKEIENAKPINTNASASRDRLRKRQSARNADAEGNT